VATGKFNVPFRTPDSRFEQSHRRAHRVQVVSSAWASSPRRPTRPMPPSPVLQEGRPTERTGVGGAPPAAASSSRPGPTPRRRPPAQRLRAHHRSHTPPPQRPPASAGWGAPGVGPAPPRKRRTFRWRSGGALVRSDGAGAEMPSASQSTLHTLSSVKPFAGDRRPSSDSVGQRQPSRGLPTAGPERVDPQRTGLRIAQGRHQSRLRAKSRVLRRSTPARIKNRRAAPPGRGPPQGREPDPGGADGLKLSRHRGSMKPWGRREWGPGIGPS